MDQLLIDVDAGGRVVVSVQRDGEEAASPADEGPREVAWPFDEVVLEDLRWYLEEYLRAPFAVYADRGATVEGRIRGWGEALFGAVFGSGAARDAYQRLRGAGGPMQVLVRSASPRWLEMPWELLWDPEGTRPVVLEVAEFARTVPAAAMPPVRAVRGSGLRVLLVIARPAGLADVGFRTIARPLFDRLAAVAGEVVVEVLRPPTIEALQRRLAEAREQGRPFDVVHFDGHGRLRGRGVAGGLGPATFMPDGAVGVLSFETADGGKQPVAAEQFAGAVTAGGVPVVVLNACQSGALGEQAEAAIATRMLAEGAAAVVAMGYNVYVVAAAEFMAAFYQALFDGKSVAAAVTAGRRRLYDHPERISVQGPTALRDWMVPVHYSRSAVAFPDLRSLPAVVDRGWSLDEALDRMRDGAAAGDPSAGDSPVEGPVEGFVGRDGEFYRLERALAARRLVVVHGPAGTGKTELARAFAQWWAATGGAQEVVWCSFEPGVPTFGVAGLLASIGRQLSGEWFREVPEEQRRPLIERALREHRCLLVWDNFETVHSMPDPGRATPPLDEADRADLLAFAAAITGPGSASAVLVTSRTPEDWLTSSSALTGAPLTAQRIELHGLEPEEAAEYANRLLGGYPRAQTRRRERAYAELLVWLDGHPMSMRIILPQLDTTSPRLLLDGLQGQGVLPDGFEPDAGRTGSLGASVKYSLDHLDLDVQQLLLAVALFHGVADVDVLTQMSQSSAVPELFARVDRERWLAALDAAARVELLTRIGGGMYRIHPALPGYLTAQWAATRPDTHQSERDAAQAAVVDAYAAFGDWLYQQIRGGDAATAFALIDWQRRTMGVYLQQALRHERYRQAQSIVQPLDDYWKVRGATEEARHWVDRCRDRLEAADGTAPPLDGEAGALWLFVTTAQAIRERGAGRLDDAQATYDAIRRTLEAAPDAPDNARRLAATYHQLGIVAQERGRLDDAEAWYQRSLTIEEELGNRSGMATSYHQLGIVAQLRGRLDDAQGWYQRSLTIKAELDDWPGMASSYHQLGTVAQRRGRLDEAEAWYQRSLTITEELGNRSGMADSYHQLGTVAQQRGQLDDAEAWYQRSLTIRAQLGNPPGMADTYHQLGTVAQARGRLDDAEAWYQRSLTIRAQLGAPPGMTDSYHQLGRIAQLRGRLDDAEAWYQRALTIDKELGNRPGMASTYGQLGLLAEVRDNAGQALRLTVQCVALFDAFPHAATGPAPGHLLRLTRQLGIDALKDAWLDVTSNEIPAAVLQTVEQALRDHDEESP